jgi:hypothetical protein
MHTPQKGDRYISDLTGHSMVVTGVTKKEITIEVERRIFIRSTAEIKMEKRTRVVPLHLWGLCSASYSRET